MERKKGGRFLLSLITRLASFMNGSDSRNKRNGVSTGYRSRRQTLPAGEVCKGNLSKRTPFHILQNLSNLSN